MNVNNILSFSRSLILSFSLFLLSNALLSAQTWRWVNIISGRGEMGLQNLAIDSRQNTFVSGTFSDQFFLLDADYTSFGRSDNYLIRVDSLGEIRWVVAGGSTGNDTDSGICVDMQDNLYWVGGFWIEGDYGDVTFRSTKSSKSIFIIKYDSEGEVLWTKLLEGTGAKDSAPPITDAEDNLFLTGFFSDTLFFDDQFLVANAATDVFISKWDSEGSLIWANHFGIDGINNARRIAINQSNEIIIGGIYRGQLAFLNDTITANTPDFDVFLAATNEDGHPLWVRKAGGVLEDDFSNFVLDQSDNIYVTGQYTGRMTLSDTIEITTNGFNDNAYLLKYAPDGIPLWAKSIGSTSFETSTDILLNEQELVIAGYFDGRFSVDDVNTSANGQLDGYLLKIDTTNGVANSISSFPADNILLINDIEQYADNTLAIGGTFRGATTFNGEVFQSPNNFSIFIGAYDELSTSIPSLTTLPKFDIYPNPTSDWLYLETAESQFTVQLWSLTGQLLHSSDNSKAIDISALETGTYLLILTDSSFYKMVRKVVIF